MAADGLPLASDAWLHGLLESVGSGILPHGGSRNGWLDSSEAIAEAHAVHGHGIAHLDGWEGVAGHNARTTAHAAQKCVRAQSQCHVSMSRTVAAACADIADCRARLDRIGRDFLAKVGPVAAASLGPAGPVPLLTLTIDHLGRALQVIDRTRTRLADHIRDLPAPAPAPGPAHPPRTPRSPGTSHPSTPDATSVMAGRLSRLGVRLATMSAEAAVHAVQRILDSALPSAGGSRHTPAAPGRHPSHPAPALPDTEHRQVRLPDGSTVTAPNDRAAKAVRAALSQRGVPYRWGGSTPGQGFDCSGLTKYAYEQAGVDLPRLASDQGSGHRPIAESDVMPGDLAVWEGHVAMVVGNGEMIDTTQSVEITRLRTDNGGMRFHGFFRPTA